MKYYSEANVSTDRQQTKKLDKAKETENLEMIKQLSQLSQKLEHLSSAVVKYKQSYELEMGTWEEEIVDVPPLPQEKSYGTVMTWMDLLGKLTVEPLTQEEAIRKIVNAIKSHLNRKMAMLQRR